MLIGPLIAFFALQHFLSFQVVHGLLQAHPSTIKSREHWIELLAHETARVFYDRLTDEKDRIFYCSVLTTVLKHTFNVKWTTEKYGPDSLLFGDFLDINAGEYERLYRCVRDPKQLAQILEVCVGAIIFNSCQVYLTVLLMLLIILEVGIRSKHILFVQGTFCCIATAAYVFLISP